MFKKYFIALAIALLSIPQAMAETKTVSKPVSSFLFKELVPSPVSVKVMKVIDAQTFMGEDKNIYTLGGIEIPNAVTGKADITADAAEALTELIEGQELKTYLTKKKDQGRLNRMNQMIVQAELRQGSIWVQGEMLARGMARVRTTPSNPELAAEMFALENEARAVKRGLWAQEKLQVLSPETAIGTENSFQLVEGAPISAAVTRNMIFLNFSEDYKKDFTIGFPTKLRTAFARQGIDPLQFAHTKIRARGWVQSYNGPFIEIDHPQQIEILGKIQKPLVTQSLPEPSPGKAGMRTISHPQKPIVDPPEPPKPGAAGQSGGD